MSNMFCKYCGTQYETNGSKCPLCGASNIPAVTDDFDFLDRDNEFEAKPAAGDDDVKVYAAELKNEYEETRTAPIPAGISSYEKQNAVRPEQKKSNGTVKVVLLSLIVLALMVALFFAAKATGLFDGAGKEDDSALQEDEELQLPLNDAVVRCTGLTLDYTEMTLAGEGTAQKLNLTVEPADCTEKVHWVSSFPEIADVDAEGNVIAKTEGTVNILAVCGDQAVTCLVTVTAVPEEEPEEEPEETPEEPEEEPADTVVRLNYSDVTLSNPGEKLQLELLNLPEGENVKWSASDDVTVSVDETGLVVATATGTCKVFAEVGEDKYECIIRCNLGTEPGQKITATLNQTDITMFYSGEQYQLKVELVGETGQGKTYKWESSDEDVCTVDENGIVMAVGKGTAFVTVEVDDVTLRCTVRVNIEESTAG